jgi:hypothetical protein
MWLKPQVMDAIQQLFLQELAPEPKPQTIQLTSGRERPPLVDLPQSLCPSVELQVLDLLS